MRLLTRRHRAAPEQLPDSPRDIAVEWIAGRIRDGRAGLDPFDPRIFILIAGENERVWAYTSLELAGLVISRHRLSDRGERFRAELQADVRATLGLNDHEPPVVADEPLASRNVAVTHADAAIDATLAVLPSTPRFRVVPETH